MKESFSIALAGPGPANPPGIPKLPVSAINSPIARPFCTPFILCTTGDADNIMEVGPSAAIILAVLIISLFGTPVISSTFSGVKSIT